MWRRLRIFEVGGFAGTDNVVAEGERSHNAEVWHQFEQAAGMMPGASVRRVGMSVARNHG